MHIKLTKMKILKNKTYRALLSEISDLEKELLSINLKRDKNGRFQRVDKVNNFAISNNGKKATVDGEPCIVCGYRSNIDAVIIGIKGGWDIIYDNDVILTRRGGYLYVNISDIKLS